MFLSSLGSNFKLSKISPKQATHLSASKLWFMSFYKSIYMGFLELSTRSFPGSLASQIWSFSRTSWPQDFGISQRGHASEEGRNKEMQENFLQEDFLTLMLQVPNT